MTENRTKMLLDLARQSIAEGIEKEAHAISLALTIGHAKRYAEIDEVEIPSLLLDSVKSCLEKLPIWDEKMVGLMADSMGKIYAAREYDDCESALSEMDNLFVVYWAMVGVGKAKEEDVLALAGAALKAIKNLTISEELAEAAGEMWLDLGPMDRIELTWWLEEIANHSNVMKQLNEGFATLARQRKGVDIMFKSLSKKQG